MKRFFVITGVLIVLLFGLLFYRQGCSSRIRNVILISIDTCRADHLSCYGFKQKTTPNIDRIADEGVLFENTVSPVPVTLPGHSSMLTGTIPPYHGVHDNGYPLDQGNVTLAERLKENGFTTGGIISAFVLDSGFGIDQGFDSYNDRFENPLKTESIEQRAGGETTRFANEWLEDHKAEKFFLFLHYFDPHFIYDAPEPFRSRFMLDPYAGEVAYADHCIGQVIDKLKELGLYGSTLIIITSDHGESLGEHGEKTHSYFIYQSTIRVPLIFRIPGGSEGVRISRNVSLVDITPTVCKLLGIEFSNEIQGKDLTGYIKDPDSEPYRDRYLYCQSLEPTKYKANSLLGVINDKYKYIQTSRKELYDLQKDPAELNNLIEEQPNQARIMHDRLEQILEQLAPDMGKVQLDDETVQRLASLGYVSGSVDKNFELDENRDDPKDLIEYSMLDLSISLFAKKGQYDSATEACQQMLSLRPDLCNGYFNFGKISLMQKDYANATAYLEKAIELKPDHLYSHVKLAEAFNALGKLDKAIEHFLKANEINPNCGNLVAQEKFDIDIRSLNTQCGTLIAQKKFDEAKIAAAKIVSFRPDYHLGYNRLAEIAMKEGNYPESIMYLKKVVEFDPESFQAHDNLGRLYNSVGKFNEAIKHFNEALRLKPDFVGVLNHLAWILATCEDTELYDPTKAVKLAEKACVLTGYKRPELLDTLAAGYAAAGIFDKAVKTSQKAFELANSESNKNLAENIKKRQELYKQGEAYIDPRR